MKKPLIVIILFSLLLLSSSVSAVLTDDLRSFVNWNTDSEDLTNQYDWGQTCGFLSDNPGFIGNGSGERCMSGNVVGNAVDRLTDYPKFTMCQWMNVSNPSPSSSVGVLVYFQENDFGWQFNQTTDDYTDFVIGNQTDGTEFTGWDNVLTPGDWQHVCIMSDSTIQQMTLYVNGVSEGVRSYDTSTLAQIGNLELDFNGGAGADRYLAVDEWGIWNRTLSGTEVQELYQFGLDQVTYPFTVDSNTPPTITILSPANGSSSSNPVSFSMNVTDSDGDNVTCSGLESPDNEVVLSSFIQGSAVITDSQPFSEGQHTFYVTCADGEDPSQTGIFYFTVVPQQMNSLINTFATTLIVIVIALTILFMFTKSYMKEYEDILNNLIVVMIAITMLGFAIYLFFTFI